MTKLAPEWVRTSDPVIRSPARYRWTTAAAHMFRGRDMIGHRSVGAADEVASCLARGVVLGMFERTDVY